jgi:hypothetical protein
MHYGASYQPDGPKRPAPKDCLYLTYFQYITPTLIVSMPQITTVFDTDPRPLLTLILTFHISRVVRPFDKGESRDRADNIPL